MAAVVVVERSSFDDDEEEGGWTREAETWVRWGRREARVAAVTLGVCCDSITAGSWKQRRPLLECAVCRVSSEGGELCRACYFRQDRRVWVGGGGGRGEEGPYVAGASQGRRAGGEGRDGEGKEGMDEPRQ